MRFRDTTSRKFFEAKYQAATDPWNFAKSEYEQQRYAAILRALAPNRYRSAWEPACSVGVLTERLATICDRVDASDLSPTAVVHAQERCRLHSNVHISCAGLDDSVFAEGYDLVVLSEVGYYFTGKHWRKVITRIAEQLRPEATLLASHWLGKSPDHVISGDDVHRAFLDLPHFHLEHRERNPHPNGGFLLERWRKRVS